MTKTVYLNIFIILYLHIHFEFGSGNLLLKKNQLLSPETGFIFNQPYFLLSFYTIIASKLLIYFEIN